MPGKLIFVSGLSGAGKSILIRAALDDIPNLSYLHTVTTRPKRHDEDNSLEYSFVTDKQYERLRSNSADWDHTEYNGFKYGADADATIRALQAGQHIICSVAPDLLVIQVMEKLYQTKPLTVWIDTPVRTAWQRTAADALRSARQEDEFAKTKFSHIFPPTGNIATDRADFIRMLQHLIG